MTINSSIRQEDGEQLARLWTQAQPVVSSYILALVPNFHQAEDILQEVAVTLVRKYEQYDQSRPFLSWALGIAKNAALESRRRTAREFERLFTVEMADRIAIAYSDQADNWGATRLALQTCLKKQGSKSLELLRWRYGNNMKPQDIAQKMGVTAVAVRVALHRLKAALQKCVRRQLEAII